MKKTAAKHTSEMGISKSIILRFQGSSNRNSFHDQDSGGNYEVWEKGEDVADLHFVPLHEKRGSI